MALDLVRLDMGMILGRLDNLTRIILGYNPGKSPRTLGLPLLTMCRYYDPKSPAGSRWSKAASTLIPRMYHSTASLLPDGSVIISGSNPNADCEDMLTVAV
jgi:hypothetical protein